MLRKYWAYAAILCCLASPAQAAGIQLLDSDPGLSGAIWYPCAGEPKPVALGKLAVGADFSLIGVKDCPVTGAKLPLVIFSHGRTGWFGAHHDTAEALADAGFVVAAINHPGDNGNDPSRRDDLSVFASRPVDMIRLLDFMLRDWKDKAVVDPARIGAFLRKQRGVKGVHDLHVWPMSTTETALTVHLLVPEGYPGDAFTVEIVKSLKERFGIDHATIQIETDPDADCPLEPNHLV